MTVALGLLGGMTPILAADTQMTADNEKLGEGKIASQILMPTGDHPSGAKIAITGSGDAFNLHALQNELGDIFASLWEKPIEEFENAAKRHIKTFYRDYVAIMPDANQRPEVELIIAARRGVYHWAWTTKRNKLVRADLPVAVGIGGMYAQSLLNNLTAFIHDEDTAMLIAAYIVFQVERRNLWVGMDTQVICLNEQVGLLRKGFNAASCRQLEELFRHCTMVETRVFHRMFGSLHDTACEPNQLACDIEAIREQFLKRLGKKTN
jgi:hypothetical protein